MKILSSKTIQKMVDGRLRGPGISRFPQFQQIPELWKKGLYSSPFQGKDLTAMILWRRPLKRCGSKMVQEDRKIPDGIPAVFVHDTVKALGKLAKNYRDLFNILLSQ